MENPKTQQEMFKQAQTRIADQYDAFMEIQKGLHPLTRAELKKLIQKRPELWAKFAAYEGSLNDG